MAQTVKDRIDNKPCHNAQTTTDLTLLLEVDDDFSYRYRK